MLTEAIIIDPPLNCTLVSTMFGFVTGNGTKFYFKGSATISACKWMMARNGKATKPPFLGNLEVKTKSSLQLTKSQQEEEEERGTYLHL